MSQTEQQRRAQILRMREEQMNGPGGQKPAPMSDAEALAIASRSGTVTPEQMLSVAMLGKLVQHDITGIKKVMIGNPNIADVDASKVMPSGIAREIGRHAPGTLAVPGYPTPDGRPAGPPIVMEAPAAPTAPIQIHPITVPPNSGEQVPEGVAGRTATGEHVRVMAPVAPKDDSQIEFDFNRSANFNDIMKAVEKLEDRVILLTSAVNELAKNLTDKKKLKAKNAPDGT